MPFIHDDFMLHTEAARCLYHGYAKDMPIIDYHCHLSPREIAEDLRWENLTQVWLYGDHYKWRAMRSNGIAERLCTGDATDKEKFDAYAATVPALLRNPLYHWTHLELTRYFGIQELLSPASADAIYARAGETIARPDFSARGLMRASNVVAVCTTDDPVDDLRWHRAIAAEGFEIKVLPAWRPDKAMAVEDSVAFNSYVDRLAEAADTDIASFEDFLQALELRHAFFHAEGCRLSDHGTEEFYAEEYTEREVAGLFEHLRGGGDLTPPQVRMFKSFMLIHFGKMDHARGWVQQYHYGALRNNNSRLFAQLGPDTGFDSIGDFTVGKSLSKMLDRLDRSNQLCKTILYNLNPRDNHLLGTMLGNFQDGSVPGKMQHGSGWWFLDQKDGMEQQLESLSQLGLLSRFVGMLTDSRSFLSYTRHEYFRRILCNLLGRDIEQGLIPDDEALVGGMVRDICFNNAARYFDFGIAPR